MDAILYAAAIIAGVFLIPVIFLYGMYIVMFFFKYIFLFLIALGLLGAGLSTGGAGGGILIALGVLFGYFGWAIAKE